MRTLGRENLGFFPPKMLSQKIEKIKFFSFEAKPFFFGIFSIF
jgi:hypothetical protein